MVGGLLKTPSQSCAKAPQETLIHPSRWPRSRAVHPEDSFFFFHKEPVLADVEVPGGEKEPASPAPGPVPEARGSKVGQACQPPAGGRGRLGPDGLGSAGPGKGLEEGHGLEAELEVRPGPTALAFPGLGRTSWAAVWGWLMINRKYAGRHAPPGSEGLWLAEATSVFRDGPMT